MCFSHSLKFLFLISFFFGRVLFESVTYNLYRLLFMCTEDSILHTFCSKLRTFQVARNLSKVAQSMITCYYFRKWATYRVSHVEVCKVNHLWGVEGSISLLNYDAYIVGSRGLEIWVSSTSFQESNIGWPQQPLNYQISVKIGFLMIHSGIGHLGARDDPTIRLSNFFDEMRLSSSLKPLRLLRL